jgi:hypothetical protein
MKICMGYYECVYSRKYPCPKSGERRGQKGKVKTPKPEKVRIKKEGLDLEELCIINYTRFSYTLSMEDFPLIRIRNTGKVHYR